MVTKTKIDRWDLIKLNSFYTAFLFSSMNPKSVWRNHQSPQTLYSPPTDNPARSLILFLSLLFIWTRGCNRDEEVVGCWRPTPLPLHKPWGLMRSGLTSWMLSLQCGVLGASLVSAVVRGKKQLLNNLFSKLGSKAALLQSSNLLGSLFKISNCGKKSRSILREQCALFTHKFIIYRVLSKHIV